VDARQKALAFNNESVPTARMPPEVRNAPFVENRNYGALITEITVTEITVTEITVTKLR